jgi:uncharacterized membrane protein
MIWASLALAAVWGAGPARAQTETPVVHAVLFWQAGCPNCEKVLYETLPPILTQYGAQLEIRQSEVVSAADIDRLYEIGAAYGLAKEAIGTPLLIVGQKALVGAEQIPAELPGVIEAGLAAGGIPFPDNALITALLPETEPCLPSVPCSPEDLAAGMAPQALAPLVEQAAGPSGPGTGEATAEQPEETAPINNGFYLAYGVLAGMALALGYALALFVRTYLGRPVGTRPAWVTYLIPLLALAELGVAAYLSYVETTQARAICGPVGDCNRVQASAYAKLFGFLPVGVLGALGDVAIIAAWAWGQYRKDRLASYAPLALMGMAMFGVIFSVYLTILQPFVIKAVCIWCLSSAVLITLIMVLSLQPAQRAWEAISEAEDDEDDEAVQ